MTKNFGNLRAIAAVTVSMTYCMAISVPIGPCFHRQCLEIDADFRLFKYDAFMTARVEFDVESLVQRASLGDARAFDDLVEAFSLRLLRFLTLTRGLPLHRAEDVAQEVWIKAWSALPRRKPGPFVGWLLTIARNAATDDQKSAYQRLVKQDTEDGILPNVPSAQTNLSHPSDVVLISERLAACLEKLDMERKQVIERFAAGESQDDIAHQLLIPLGTVKSRLSRGRQDLKICLGDLAP